jgi:predicted Zn finger-like uncharacterized protein
MPIRAHCPSCQTEYTLVDSLSGKYVRCERCRQSFRAEPVRLEQTEETPPTTAVPPVILTPPLQAEVPPTILNRSSQPRTDVSLPRRREPESSGSGVGKAGFPIGIAVVVFLVIRSCTTMTNISSNNRPSRWEVPNPPATKLPENLDLRFVKDKDFIVNPKATKDAKPPEAPPPIGMKKVKDLVIVPDKP